MYLKNYLAFNFLLMSLFQLSQEDGEITFINPIRWPYGPIQGPFIGLFLAISLPLDLPEYNIFFSYNFEANYNLPQNQTEFTYPPLYERRSWDRKSVYDILKLKMKSHGYPGKECLLRMICEASLHSFDNTGVLGDIVHILFTPSTSRNSIDGDYEKAERYGRTKRNCNKYTKKCVISFLDLISWIENYI